MKKILVCEDDILTIQLIEKKLTEENYIVRIAKDGQIGIDLIESETFDMIITDIHMPHVTGLELINFVREEKKLSIPIFVLTKDISIETEEDAYTIGADEYLVKPPKPNILIFKVRKMIGDS